MAASRAAKDDRERGSLPSAAVARLINELSSNLMTTPSSECCYAAWMTAGAAIVPLRAAAADGKLAIGANSCPADGANA
jgi:hypothetical protein